MTNFPFSLIAMSSYQAIIECRRKQQATALARTQEASDGRREEEAPEISHYSPTRAPIIGETDLVELSSQEEQAVAQKRVHSNHGVIETFQPR